MQDNVLRLFWIYIIKTPLFVIRITILQKKKRGDNQKEKSSDPTHFN